MTDPAWLIIARRYLGVRELPGAANSPIIQRWLVNLRAWWADDATPWCGVFCAEVMREAGIPRPKAWYRAKAWAEWGVRLTLPVVGCVVVFERQGGGHVAFVVGTDEAGRLMCLGGNQGDAVTIAPFLRERVIAYRWPTADIPVYAPLPLISSRAASSVNES